MRNAVAFISLLLAVGSLRAQDATGISQFFEGKQVVVKIDMPGTQQGIDVYPQKEGMLDAKAYGNRMKSFPVALHSGEAVMITTVKVKDKLVEFQLGGGGFGTFGDDSDTSVKFVPASKSDREKDLEKEISNTNDRYRRDDLQRQLDYLRRQRERDDQRNKAIAEDAAQQKKYQVDQNRTKGGSRFNLKYDGKVPADLTPQDVMSSLSRYVSFPPSMTGGNPAPSQVSPATRTPLTSSTPGGGASGPVSGLQKGMHLEEVRTLLGSPTGAIDADHDGLQVHSETYRQGDSVIHADFVNGVLVRYSVDVN
jgi:hypothetical protein